MIQGTYTKVENRWCMSVNGSVKAGDQVEIPRPNGTTHGYTAARVIARHGNIRVCEIVPCLYYRQLRGLVDPSPPPMATESAHSPVTGSGRSRKPLGAPYRAYGAAPKGSSKLACALALVVAVLVPWAAKAQTAGSQVEMFLGPSIGKQWTAIFSNHPRTTGNAPVLTSCGTSPTISGTDSAGTVTTGTGTPTGCVITFNAAYTAAPACVVVWRTNIASMIYDVSATAITLTQTATDSTIVDYHCIARSGG